MARILVHVEGQTEETFVNEILRPHLVSFGHYPSARLIATRQGVRHGGIRGWDKTSRDITNHLKSDPSCYATTIVDYYALPASGLGAWSGRAHANTLPFAAKAATIQQALSDDIAQQMGANFNRNRFIPYVVMHEFEGLLFSDCRLFAQGIEQPQLTASFQKIRDEFRSPEEINDSATTAPSKRILQLIPGYEKPLLGTLAMLNIGLDAVRRECPFFNDWITQLEAIP